MDAPPSLAVVIRCAEQVVPRARYVFDTLFMACGILAEYVSAPPARGAWVLYSKSKDHSAAAERCVAIASHPDAWALFDGASDVESAIDEGGLAVVLHETDPTFDGPSDVPFDLVANAFYFLSSWSERRGPSRSGSRQLYGNSVFARVGVSQDIVDRYLHRLTTALGSLRNGLGAEILDHSSPWPNRVRFAVALTHDIDFLPLSVLDSVLQGGKTILRHLIRQRDPADALRAGTGLVRCLLTGRDPYGCVPEIIATERELGVRSSFQVAVARRHPADVNYDIKNDSTRDYLRVVPQAGFDLCLHGSYRSTERRSWYVEEALFLAERLVRPLGSRQHFLSFDYDELFGAQEEAGILYDMSMGFPDRWGPRAGFSFPYFPFNLAENRPYDVLEISLVLMDVTLRGYMGLRPEHARRVIDTELRDLQRKRGGASVVWHPIVFGGARDPGYDLLYWQLVKQVKALGGFATDGRTINRIWRERARRYASFAELSSA